MFEYKPGGLVRMRKWCEHHRKSGTRPLDLRGPKATPIPEDIKTQYRCGIEGCPRYCEVERASADVNGTMMPGWLIRTYCRVHRVPAARPVGWYPPRLVTDTTFSWKRKFLRFLGVTRWMDRGSLSKNVYRLQTGRLMHVVGAPAVSGIRYQMELPCDARETLGEFAARYNLAVAAVVGATYALMESEGHGES